jgi:hypothetical protein
VGAADWVVPASGAVPPTTVAAVAGSSVAVGLDPPQAAPSREHAARITGSDPTRQRPPDIVSDPTRDQADPIVTFS